MMKTRRDVLRIVVFPHDLSFPFQPIIIMMKRKMSILLRREVNKKKVYTNKKDLIGEWMNACMKKKVRGVGRNEWRTLYKDTPGGED